MPDRLTRPVLAILLLAVAGVACGALWELVWEPPVGVVVDGRFLLDGDGLRHEFAATASYVVIAAAAGLVLGLLLAWWPHRDELLTLAALVVGSLLAAWLMMLVGSELGPPAPEALADRVPDRTELPAALEVHGSAWAAFPVGTLTGAMIVFLGLGARRRPTMGDHHEPPAGHGAHEDPGPT